jgi:hypothetical protein
LQLLTLLRWNAVGHARFNHSTFYKYTTGRPMHNNEASFAVLNIHINNTISDLLYCRWCDGWRAIIWIYAGVNVHVVYLKVEEYIDLKNCNIKISVAYLVFDAS